MSLTLDIITPEKIVFRGSVDSVTLPTTAGEITVLPKHIPLVSIVEPGSLIARTQGREEVFAVSRGTIEVDGMTVRVLVRSADSESDLLDEAAIEKATSAARELMTEKRHDAEAFAEASAVFERELARLRSVRRRPGRRNRSHPSA